MAILCLAISLYTWVLLARVILSWFPQVPDGLRPVVGAIYSVTEPAVKIFRPLVPPLQMGNVALDLSIIILFVALRILERVVCNIRF